LQELKEDKVYRLEEVLFIHFKLQELKEDKVYRRVGLQVLLKIESLIKNHFQTLQIQTLQTS